MCEWGPMGRSRKREFHAEDRFANFGGSYMGSKWAKLEKQFQAETAEAKISEIFKGICVFVNGFTKPNHTEIKELMALHGGTFHLYQANSTTHIIASNLPNFKINKLGPIPIVKPTWITHSIEMGRLQDYKRYLLYTKQSVTQPRLNLPVLPSRASPPKTASDPSFLADFYNNSRLHLIATMGAEFKQLVHEWREASDGSFPGRGRLKAGAQPPLCDSPVIMHIDMDCFFVSVGLRSRPELRGLPVAVTHARNGQIQGSKERGAAVALNLERLPMRMENVDAKSSMSEVASCSYEARKCGVKNGMFLGAAVKLCPDLKTIPYDFEGYKEVATALYKTVASYTLDIEAVSCDEMYVDVTAILRMYNLNPETFSLHLRREIEEITGCPPSTGFGSNRLQARLATRRAKPAGCFHLKGAAVEDYMSDIPLADLPGVGRATLEKLAKLGLSVCGDLALVSPNALQKELGPKAADTLMEQAQGKDRKPLNFHHERKSVSAEINYGIRFKNGEECQNFMEKLAVEVWGRLQDIKMRARCVTLKLMVREKNAPVETAKFLGHGLCDNLSKSASGVILMDSGAVFREAKSLLDKLSVDVCELRGMGLQLSKLEKIAPINPTLGKFLQQKTTVVENQQIKQTPVSPIKVKEPQTKGTRKGRPRKAPPKNAAPLDTFIKTGSTKPDKGASTSRDSPTFPNTPSAIDLEVLKQLPIALRAEVIAEYKLDPQILRENRALVPLPTLPPESPQKQRNPFSGLQWCQLKPMLYDWVASEQKPRDCDVAMLADHFRSLAVDREIEHLTIALNFLHRSLEESGCVWHGAYVKIVDGAQEGMVARYGGVLSVDRDFKCCAR